MSSSHHSGIATFAKTGVPVVTKAWGLKPTAHIKASQPTDKKAKKGKSKSTVPKKH
jgi:hypothetical protein